MFVISYTTIFDNVVVYFLIYAVRVFIYLIIARLGQIIGLAARWPFTEDCLPIINYF